MRTTQVYDLGLAKSSFGFFLKIVWKTPNKLLGQPSEAEWKGKGPGVRGSVLWSSFHHQSAVWSFVVVQSLSWVWLFVTRWTAVRQPSLSFTIFQSLLKLMSSESVMLFNSLILCHPLLLLPSIFPSIRVLSNELAVCIKWSICWSFSISPSNE